MTKPIFMPESIVSRSVDELVPYARNSRTHSDAQVAKIAASIREFGWTVPILVDEDGTIVAGHGRLEAARRLKLETVPTISLGHLSDAQRRAYVLADNRLALDAGWDEELLRLELEDLQSLDFDLGLIGFSEDELEELLPKVDKLGPQSDPDDIPQVVEDPVSRTGDVWYLGDHRILCGDSTIVTDVEKLLDGRQADLVLTDPPYNVALGYDETPEQAKARKRRTDGKTVANDKMTDEQFFDFLHGVFSNLFLVTKEGGAIYVCHADSESLNFRRALKDAQWLLKQCLIWVKDRFAMGRQDYHWQHEPILYGWKPGASHRWFSDRKQTTVLNFARPSRSEEHPTMKPVELISYLLRNSSDKKELVLDPFLGSGSTLIACEQEGRVCFGLEIDPKYIDVIIRRWQTFTGRKATLEDGRTFEELESERSSS